MSTLSMWTVFFIAVWNGSRLTINTDACGEQEIEIVFGIAGLVAVALVAFPDIIRKCVDLLESGKQ